MKKQLFSFLTGFLAFGLISAGVYKMNYEPKKSTAEVEQFQGFYIFTDSKPVTEYKYMGTVKEGSGGGFKDSYYEAIKKRLAETARKEYPEGNGLIIKAAGYTATADVIKF